MRWRQSRYAVKAASAGTSTAATLYDADGPKSAVSGVKRTASPGTLVTQARFTPSGA